MNKHLSFILIVLISLATACLPQANAGGGTATVAPPTAVPANPTPTIIPTQPPVEPTVPPPTPEPTAPPIATIAPKPHFKNLRFTAGDEVTAVSFRGGVPEIFAVWEYQQLQPTDVMKRIWTRNGAEWLVREENWDFATYGATGTIDDVSVFDFEDGLEPGSYALALSINGHVQVEAAFVIEERPLTGTITLSAAGSSGQTAIVLDKTKLVLEEANGQRTQLATALEISEIAWFPNGQQFLFVEQDDSEQLGGSSLGIKHALRHVDVATSAITKIGSFDEDYHTLSISPNGRFVRIIAGSNFADACGVDRALFILEVNGESLPVARFDMATFVAPPADSFVYPFARTDGEWTGENKLLIEVDALCFIPEEGTLEEQNTIGVYFFDPATQTAERVGDLR